MLWLFSCLLATSFGACSGRRVRILPPQLRRPPPVLGRGPTRLLLHEPAPASGVSRARPAGPCVRGQDCHGLSAFGSRDESGGVSAQEGSMEDLSVNVFNAPKQAGTPTDAIPSSSAVAQCLVLAMLIAIVLRLWGTFFVRRIGDSYTLLQRWRLAPCAFATAKASGAGGESKIAINALFATLPPGDGGKNALTGSSRAPVSLFRGSSAAACESKGPGRCTLPPSSRAMPRRTTLSAMKADWRDFRASLVSAERREEGALCALPVAQAAAAWAYQTPFMEKGSLLLSRPGNFYEMAHQHFHKSVFLVIQQSATSDLALILNRPTRLSTADIGCGDPDWDVWYGGDIQGFSDGENLDTLNMVFLHTCSRLSDLSIEIVPGVYYTSSRWAHYAIRNRSACKDDFLCFAGFCEWPAEEMREELDGSERWALAAVDTRSIIEEIRTMHASRASAQDGIAMWERLYSSLGPQYEQRVQSRDESISRADMLLSIWTERYIPVWLGDDAHISFEDSWKRAVSPQMLAQGCVLKASATAWMLGQPPESSGCLPNGFQPSQYLHKAVLLLTEYSSDGGEGGDQLARLVLLNGPPLLTGPALNILFGGPQGYGHTVYEMGVGSTCPIMINGSVVLPRAALHGLIRSGALVLAPEAIAEDIMRIPWEERWQKVGPELPEEADLERRALANFQRKKWFKLFMKIDV